MLLAYTRAVSATPGNCFDGGDVLVANRRIYVGLSTRTNRAAVEQLAPALGPLGYEVMAVEFRGCLHLKSGVTRVADGLLLLNPDWVDPRSLCGHRAVTVDPAEPHAANALAMTEPAKAEAGVTCCSLLLQQA